MVTSDFCFKLKGDVDKLQILEAYRNTILPPLAFLLCLMDPVCLIDLSFQSLDKLESFLKMLRLF